MIGLELPSDIYKRLIRQKSAKQSNSKQQLILILWTAGAEKYGLDETE